ncbi:phage tail protein, partial [Salmonella enterica subsp. enterica]|nr:phage tail protein [Salmonella enterica subsp. enterica serovar Cotham]ECC3631558.1 phage tail protein [Salmonella enterica subsp. enterica]ECD3442338.1 phage tail protein [Salmonella enterica subsp. enterica serovar Weltevreden]EED7274182.1 phage tail protein [Salmonella enterica subsp. enterica serovar Mikawasima]
GKLNQWYSLRWGPGVVRYLRTVSPGK